MAHPLALPSLGEALIARLRQAWAQAGTSLPADLPPCRFAQLSAAQLAAPPDAPGGLEIGLLLHHISFAADDLGQGRPDPLGLSMSLSQPGPLAPELHYLLTVRGPAAAQEQLALAWAMAELQAIPLLDTAGLPEGAGWSAQERIELLQASLGPAELQAIWRALGVPQRLSVGYVARGLRLDGAASGGGGVW